MRKKNTIEVDSQRYDEGTLIAFEPLPSLSAALCCSLARIVARRRRHALLPLLARCLAWGPVSHLHAPCIRLWRSWSIELCQLHRQSPPRAFAPLWALKVRLQSCRHRSFRPPWECKHILHTREIQKVNNASFQESLWRIIVRTGKSCTPMWPHYDIHVIWVVFLSKIRTYELWKHSHHYSLWMLHKLLRKRDKKVRRGARFWFLDHANKMFNNGKLYS